jgi:hypothetical protein
MSASIYLCLGRLINVHGSTLSRLRLRTYAFIFVTCDLLFLFLQATGGALAATGGSYFQEGQQEAAGSGREYHDRGAGVPGV